MMMAKVNVLPVPPAPTLFVGGALPGRELQSHKGMISASEEELRRRRTLMPRFE